MTDASTWIMEKVTCPCCQGLGGTTASPVDFCPCCNNTGYVYSVPKPRCEAFNVKVLPTWETKPFLWECVKEGKWTIGG